MMPRDDRPVNEGEGKQEWQRIEERVDTVADYCSEYGPPVPIEALARVRLSLLRRGLGSRACSRLRRAGISSTVIPYAWRRRGMAGLAQRCGLPDPALLERVLDLLARYSWDPCVAAGFADYLREHGLEAAAEVHGKVAEALRVLRKRRPSSPGKETTILQGSFLPDQLGPEP